MRTVLFAPSRKIFSLLAVMAILFAGCAPAVQPTVESTSAPVATEAPVAQPAATEVVAPAATEAPVAQPAATEAVAPAATEAPTEVPAASAPVKSDKVVTIAYAAGITGVDPHQAKLIGDWGVGLHIFERLWEYGPEGGDPIPVLATSWEFNADQTALTVKLREGVKFHDGTPWNAAAAKYNLDRLSNKEKPVRNRGGLEKAIASTDVIDEYTVKINMAQPFPPLFRLLGRAPSGMVSPTALDKYGDDFNAHPVGTGPFVFKEWIQGQSFEMVRNEDYWGEPAPAAGIKYVQVAEPATRIAMIEAGDAQIADIIPYSEVDRLKTEKGIQVRADPSEYSYYVAMNEKTPAGPTPFADKNVRLAMNYAVDKEGIIKDLLKGYGKVSTSSVGTQTPQHCDAGYYAYDPAKAKALLAEAGYPNGFKTNLVTVNGKYPMDAAVAEAIQGYLAEVGVQVEILTLDTGAYSTQILADFGKGPVPNPEMVFRGFSSGGALDAGILMTQQTTANWPPNGFNVAYYSNPEFDALVAKANATWDEAARKDELCQAQKIFFDYAHWIFLYYLDNITIYSDSLKGVVVTPGDLIDLRKAYIE